jgi:hypothetical protein
MSNWSLNSEFTQRYFLVSIYTVYIHTNCEINDIQSDVGTHCELIVKMETLLKTKVNVSLFSYRLATC